MRRPGGGAPLLLLALLLHSACVGSRGAVETHGNHVVSLTSDSIDPWLVAVPPGTLLLIEFFACVIPPIFLQTQLLKIIVIRLIFIFIQTAMNLFFYGAVHANTINDI